MQINTARLANLFVLAHSAGDVWAGGSTSARRELFAQREGRLQPVVRHVRRNKCNLAIVEAKRIGENSQGVIQCRMCLGKSLRIIGSLYPIL